MSTTETRTVTVIPDRTCRIVIEKPLGQTPVLMTFDEKIVDGISTFTGNMRAEYDSTNPLDVALYSAMEAKIISMRRLRDGN